MMGNVPRCRARFALLASLSCALGVFALLFAQDPARANGTSPDANQPMNLGQAVDFGLAHNPAVIKASAAVSDAGATLARDRAANLPTLSGNLQNQMQKSANSGQFAQIGVPVAPTFSQNTAALRANFNGLNLTNIDQARSDKQAFDQAKQQLVLAQEQSTQNVETSFYAVAQDEQLTGIAQENVNYNRTLMLIADVNYRAGKVAGLDRLKAQVAYTSALEQLASAQADQEDARENLAQLIAAPMAQQFAIPSTLPEPPLPDLDRSALDQLALANRPEVAIAEAQVNAALISNNLVDAPNRPNVQMLGEWGNQVSPTNNALILNNFNACVAAGNPPAACEPGGSHFYEISIISTWTLPLIDYGTLHAAHTSAHREIDSQIAQLASTKQQALIDVDQAVRRLLVDRDNLTLAASNVEVAKQAASISAAQYKVGIISQTDVTAAQQSYLTAAKDLLNAQVAYLLGIATLKKATGTLTGAV